MTEMTKGGRTRERIVAAAAPLFNQRGYAASSMSDLMVATGLEKGGIYRHFASKDELALAAFDHTLAAQTERIRLLVNAEDDAIGRLTALASGIAGAMSRSAIAGGCPLLNTAIESDDGTSPAHAALRKRARVAMRQLIDYARRIIERGIDEGELSAAVNAKAEAQSFVAGIEGALMLSKLYDDPEYVEQAVERVGQHFRRIKRQRRQTGEKQP
jgi:TetR/AcrR family transcriptional repressor of nem operon